MRRGRRRPPRPAPAGRGRPRAKRDGRVRGPGTLPRQRAQFVKRRLAAGKFRRGSSITGFRRGGRSAPARQPQPEGWLPMTLGLVNNVSALNAQNNLTRTNNALSKSLERLSSGLKINRGADGPAALVISEKQRAQIAGLRTAIDNTS